jgi:hypothetical protein
MPAHLGWGYTDNVVDYDNIRGGLCSLAKTTEDTIDAEVEAIRECVFGSSSFFACQSCQFPASPVQTVSHFPAFRYQSRITT